MKNSIAFSRGLVTFEPGNNRDKTAQLYAATCAAELTRLGYVLDQNGIKQLSTLTVPAMRAFTTEMVNLIRGKLGAKHPFKPFYVNFPESVMEMSHFELYLNAIIHYWSNGTWEPAQELIARGPFSEPVEMSKLRFVTEDEFKMIFTEIVSANQSLSSFNKNAMEWFVKTYSSRLTFPASIPFKETLASLAKLGADVPVRQETDVLRIALAMSDVDTAILPLPQTKPPKRGFRNVNALRAVVQVERDKHKFRKFSRPERKYLLSLLEKTYPKAEEMQRHADRWLRLGEILHVGEYKNQFPMSFAAFDRVRKQDPKVRTFNSDVEFAFKNGNVDEAISLLVQRPGEYARRLDSLLRKHDVKKVLKGLSQVIDRVSSKVLLELFDHISARTEETTRSVIAKGSRRAQTLETVPALPKEVVGEAISTIMLGMSHGLAKLPKMKKVYVDPRLSDLGIVKGARTQGDQLRTMARGARLPIDADAKTLRIFIHWQDDHGHEDLDLSSNLYDEKYEHTATCSFYDLKGSGMYHSGDIRHRKGSCAEYIDINFDELPKTTRYISLDVYNYNGRPLSSVKDCVAGFMTRQKPKSGEIFEPLTVKNAMVPSSTGTSTTVCLFDVKERKMIWADLDNEGVRFGANTAATLKNILRKPELSIEKLLKLHVSARGGRLVNSPEEADEVFSWDELAFDPVKLANFATW